MNLKELSRALNLSQTTVSRALNGYPEVGEATRKRVQAEAQRLGYAEADPTAPAYSNARRESTTKVLDSFQIDFSHCMWCGICVEVCPFDALFWSQTPLPAGVDRADLVLDTAALESLLPGAERADGSAAPAALKWLASVEPVVRSRSATTSMEDPSAVCAGADAVTGMIGSVAGTSGLNRREAETATGEAERGKQAEGKIKRTGTLSVRFGGQALVCTLFGAAPSPGRYGAARRGKPSIRTASCGTIRRSRQYRTDRWP